ncbi:MAG TPA: type II toxin-antitoxin system PemK/MazF family toxin [Candidatus Tectomicrobia bacterium]|nr:type II toxin-antitoxin system PemK/MazF family toxin [Candidatus Tectomicrobia bacterium]
MIEDHTRGRFDGHRHASGEDRDHARPSARRGDRPRGEGGTRRRRRRLSIEARRLDLRLKNSWVEISQVRTLAVERSARRIGALSSDEVDHIVEGLFQLVG